MTLPKQVHSTFLFLHNAITLHSSSRDEEPLVDATVDRRRGKVLALGDVGELGLVHAVGGVGVGDVGAGRRVSILQPKKAKSK